MIDDPLLVQGTANGLPDAPQLFGFPPALCDSRGASLLLHPCQKQYQVQAALIASGGSDQKCGAGRSDWRVDDALFAQGLDLVSSEQSIQPLLEGVITDAVVKLFPGLHRLNDTALRAFRPDGTVHGFGCFVHGAERR